MFRRKKKPEVTAIELPSLDDLEGWVFQIISQLELKKGEFTFIPAYGGILLFVRAEGISWLPYNEIREVLGKVDKNSLAESTALAGSVVAAGSGAIIPIFLARGIVKGSYRTFVKPPPNVSLSILKSLIDHVEITPQNKVSGRVLEKLETSPFKDKQNTVQSYRFVVYKKFFSKHSKSASGKILKGIKNFISRTIELDFIIPGQSDLAKFSEILTKNGIQVDWLTPVEISDNGDENED